MAVHAGECLCGRIRYEIDGDIPDAHVCHCSICRKAFGAVGSYVSWIDPARFRWVAGEEYLKTYANKHGYAIGFCGECGSTLGVIHDGKTVCVTLSGLNGAPDVRVARHIFVGSKGSWDDIGGDAPQFHARPPGAGEA